ncbi:uncharacterized protein METZ01_LOCUS489654 [marine metagenome]|uniref:Uncharacterized protein n=1 Tax=marine metagenome TaxID=408172 RepID=A0A383CXM5_9ZZZZ
MIWVFQISQFNKKSTHNNGPALRVKCIIDEVAGKEN